MSPLLEIAAFSLEAALIAGHAGADRIELCVNYLQGGLTPPQQAIAAVKARLDCPVFVMIRPRAGDFIYTASELDQMKRELIGAKQSGADGFVFGIVNADGEINESANSALVALSHPLPCTFHRAFDNLADKEVCLEKLIECGFQRVLTSGGPGSAGSHINTLKALVARAAGRIIVMPGGGIRPENVGQLTAEVGATEYHSAAIVSNSELPDKLAIAAMRQSLHTGK